MKDTATSCMLIATVVFAVAFTVPGGNNEETRLPILQKKKWFNIFILSYDVALCSSSTDIVIFLSILTSRYAEDDFLVSLPSRLMLGLLALFVSIIAMIIAFFYNVILDLWVEIRVEFSSHHFTCFHHSSVLRFATCSALV